MTNEQALTRIDNLPAAWGGGRKLSTREDRAAGWRLTRLGYGRMTAWVVEEDGVARRLMPGDYPSNSRPTEFEWTDAGLAAAGYTPEAE